MSYVYLIRRDKFFKIGTTNSPPERIIQLQIGSPEPLELVCAFCFENARAVEVELHKRFERVHHRGEWYKLSAQDVTTFQWGCEMLGGYIPIESDAKLPIIPKPAIELSEVGLTDIETKVMRFVQGEKDADGRAWFKTTQISKALRVGDTRISQIGQVWEKRGWLSGEQFNFGRVGKNGRILLIEPLTE